MCRDGFASSSDRPWGLSTTNARPRERVILVNEGPLEGDRRSDRPRPCRLNAGPTFDTLGQAWKALRASRTLHGHPRISKITKV